MKNQLLIAGGILAALSVVFGAFAAHWLKAHISAVNLQNFDTAVHYQMYHALAILFLATLSEKFHIKLFRLAFYAFFTGIIFFSGSIYLLATREVTGLQLSWIGPVTPVGGLLFITGWVLLIFTALRIPAKPDNLVG
ncbi:MAG: DUF423 domain-containing protein [Bacteroidales bacterium]|nr:DUF423 domain-containing protein [Bacteroidales bacterium]